MSSLQLKPLPSYLLPTPNGFKHKHKNIHIRITSKDNITPVLKAAERWLKIKDVEQDNIVQSDELWDIFEDEIKMAKTDLEVYSIFQKIPKTVIKYKDLCNNNVVHRLILALKKQKPEIVEGVWYLLEREIKPYMHLVNDFGHTPWELMGAIPDAFEIVLKGQGAELLNLVPIRTWRKHQVYVSAWNLATKEQHIRFARVCKRNNLDLLCYLTQNNPHDIDELTRDNILLLEGCTLDIKNSYPDHLPYLLANLIEKNMLDAVLILTESM